MLTPYLFDPTSRKSVTEQVEYNDKLNLEKAHRPLNMRIYLDDDEIDQLQAAFETIPISEKPVAIWRSCFELITRALIVEEEFTPETAADFINAGIGCEQEMLPQIREVVTTSIFAPIQILLDMASTLHFELTKKIFVTSMELHNLDYRSLFPQRVCVHSPDMVLKRMKNPKFKPTAEERKTYFKEYKEQSFSIMNSMSIWEIADIVPMESMQTLQNAGRYSILKPVYADDSPTTAPAKKSESIKSELKGKVL